MMQRFFATRTKLLTSAALITAILLVLGAVGLALLQDSLHRAERQKIVSAQANVLAASIGTALSRDDKHAAQETVDALKENPDIEAAAIFRTNGTIVARFVRSGAQPIPALAALEDTHGIGQIAVSETAIHDNLTLGTVYIRTIKEPAWNYWARYLPIILLASMSAMLIAVLARAQSSLAQTNN